MKPRLEKTSFGSITIDGKKYKHDVLIRLDGKVEKRKKKLSKAIYGSSHMISLDEAKYIYEPGAHRVLIGTGQFDSVKLSPEAEAFFQQMNCQAQLLPTGKALQGWNDAPAGTIGMFHITC